MNTVDNWKHKSSGMLCNTCMYFVAKGLMGGRCRRHAPTLEGWPVMFKTDWCGDHKLQPDIKVPVVDGFNPGEIRWVDKDVEPIGDCLEPGYVRWRDA